MWTCRMGNQLVEVVVCLILLLLLMLMLPLLLALGEGVVGRIGEALAVTAAADGAEAEAAMVAGDWGLFLQDGEREEADM